MNKFEKEITALKALGSSRSALDPIRKQQLKANLLREISGETIASEKRFIWQERTKYMIRYVIATLLGVTLVGGTVFAAGNAKPGEPLFAVKKAKENIQISLTHSAQAKAKLEAKFARERLDELNEVAALDINSKSDTKINGNNTETANTIASLNTSGNTSLNKENSNGNTDNGTNTNASNTTNIKAQTSDDPALIAAQNQASLEVNEAIRNLKKVEADLTASGDTQAALQIKQEILNLQAQAQKEQIDIKDENDNQNEQGDNQTEVNEDANSSTIKDQEKDSDNNGVNTNNKGEDKNLLQGSANTDSSASVNSSNTNSSGDVHGHEDVKANLDLNNILK